MPWDQRPRLLLLAIHIRNTLPIRRARGILVLSQKWSRKRVRILLGRTCSEIYIFFVGLFVFLDPKATQDIPATRVSSLPLRPFHGSSSDSGESHGHGYHRNSALRLRDSGLGGVTGIFLSMKTLRYCDLKMRSEISGCTDIILIRYATLELLRFV